MAHNITETATFDAPITVPDDGDADVVASVNGPFQALADRTRYLLEKLSGLLVSGSFSGTGTLILYDGIPVLDISDAILSTVNNGFNIPSVAASTWYYVYAYNNAGAIGFEVSTVFPSPVNGYTFKNGDTTRRYLTCFRTDSSSTMIPFYVRRGRYRYVISRATTGISNSELSKSLSATAWTNLSLASAVPGHVQEASVQVKLTNTAGTWMALEFRSVSTDGAIYMPTYVVPDASATTGGYYDLITDSSQQVQYQFANGAPSGCSLVVTGFQE